MNYNTQPLKTIQMAINLTKTKVNQKIKFCINEFFSKKLANRASFCTQKGQVRLGQAIRKL